MADIIGINKQISTNSHSSSQTMNRTNHFLPSEKISQIDENQFMFSPSRITEFSTKDETIKRLEEKNARLQSEINRIDRVLQEPEQKTMYGIKIPQLKKQVTQQQLDNAYKRIKAYQHELQKLKGIQSNGPYIEQIRKAQTLLKQKEELADKLRRELADIKKASKDLVKHLKNDNIKQEYQNKSHKLNTEVKWLREKVREAQNKQQMNKRNRQKQLLFIRKLQNQLIKSGFPQSTLQGLKNKYNTYDNQRTGYSRMSQIREQREEDLIQDRTPQAYKISINQIKLLQKMEKDYSQKIQLIAKQFQEASSINLKSRNRLIEVEDQIQQIQAKINQLKPLIDPAKLKPQRALSVEASVGRYGRVNQSLTSIKNTFKHLFKTEEFGKVSKAGRRFSDRPKIGKVASKIIAIDFFQAKDEPFNIVGLQATYQVKKIIKKGPVNMIIDPRLANKRNITFTEPEDYLKGLQCIVNDKGIIIGIGVISAKGISDRAGPSEGARRPLSISRVEYPVCIYGSFTEKGLQLLGAEVVQQPLQTN